MKKENNYIKIFDTTLRDGEQSPGASMNIEEKLKIAEALEDLKVDIIEAGFPAASKGDYEAVSEISKKIKNSSICALSRASKNDIQTAADALKNAAAPRIHTFISTSELHMKHKLQLNSDEVYQKVIDSVSFARNLCDDVEWSCEDGTRTDMDYMCKTVELAIKSGAKTINIPDTVGYTVHSEFTKIIETLLNKVTNIDKAILIDNTGVYRDKKGLSKHLKSKGVSKVLLTAPTKGELKNIVYGVNHKDIRDKDKILGAASCTTNAIVPLLKAISEEYGIDNGHVETVHSYTNDQNLIDNYHDKARRGRSAALNMVLTETGAAKAVSQVLPELEGKLSANAIRVPTPNVSMAILNLYLEKESTVEKLNDFLRKTAFHSIYKDQIDYTNSPEIVSSDIIGSRFGCVVDSQATICNGKNVVIYAWYDNELGYCVQLLRVLKKMAGIKYLRFPLFL